MLGEQRVSRRSERRADGEENVNLEPPSKVRGKQHLCHPGMTGRYAMAHT